MTMIRFCIPRGALCPPLDVYIPEKQALGLVQMTHVILSKDYLKQLRLDYTMLLKQPDHPLDKKLLRKRLRQINSAITKDKLKHKD